MSLVQRGQCAFPFCRCPRTVFTRTEYRPLPLDANEKCNCDHQWWKHLAYPTSTARRGACPSVHCGGYLSSVRTEYHLQSAITHPKNFSRMPSTSTLVVSAVKPMQPMIHLFWQHLRHMLAPRSHCRLSLIGRARLCSHRLLS